jgi:hypothetical protein
MMASNMMASNLIASNRLKEWSNISHAQKPCEVCRFFSVPAGRKKTCESLDGWEKRPTTFGSGFVSKLHLGTRQHWYKYRGVTNFFVFDSVVYNGCKGGLWLC